MATILAPSFAALRSMRATREPEPLLGLAITGGLLGTLVGAAIVVKSYMPDKIIAAPMTKEERVAATLAEDPAWIRKGARKNPDMEARRLAWIASRA